MEKRCSGCMQIKIESPICEHCGYNENINNLAHQLSVDTLLNNRFRLGKVLGQGGFGITYIGWDEKDDVAVAVKEYYPKTVVDRDVDVSTNVVCRDENGQAFFHQYRELFLQEAKTLEKFSNVPQIVHVKTVFEENNTVYMAMEYVRGTNLQMYLRMAGLLNAKQTFQIFRPVMEALIKVHESGLVHKDISPDNIMILPDGQAKLLDFGAAQDVVHGAPKKKDENAVVVVKHGFAPYEQYQKEDFLGPWTDVYALCATIYYCMTGKIPPMSKDRLKDKRMNWSGAAGLNRAQLAALKRGLEPMPGDRFQDVKQLYNALFLQEGIEELEELEIITEEDDPVPEPVPKPKPDPKPERKPMSAAAKKKILIAAACIVLVIAAAYFLSLPKGWAQENGITCYYQMGNRVTGLQKIDAKTYLFDSSGAMMTGWQTVDGGQYCFGEDGVMYTGAMTLDNMEYTFGEDGLFQHRLRSLSAQELYTQESEDKFAGKKKNGGDQSWTYQELSQPIENCIRFTAKMEMTDYKNGNTDLWKFAYRGLDGQWYEVGEPFGLTNDRHTIEFIPEEPVSFDAYVWYCVSIGNMWNFERSYSLTEATVLDYEI